MLHVSPDMSVSRAKDWQFHVGNRQIDTRALGSPGPCKSMLPGVQTLAACPGGAGVVLIASRATAFAACLAASSAASLAAWVGLAADCCTVSSAAAVHATQSEVCLATLVPMTCRKCTASGRMFLQGCTLCANRSIMHMPLCCYYRRVMVGSLGVLVATPARAHLSSCNGAHTGGGQVPRQ